MKITPIFQREGTGKSAGWMKESQAMFTGYEDKYPKLHAAIQHILDYLRLDVASKTKRIQAIENDLKKTISMLLLST